MAGKRSGIDRRVPTRRGFSTRPVEDHGTTLGEESILVALEFHPRDAVDAVLKATAFLSEHATVYVATSPDPVQLVLVGRRGYPAPPAPVPGDSNSALPDRALASGQVEPRPLPPNATALALPIKLAHNTVAVLHLDRGSGPAFSPSDLAAAQAVAAVAGPLFRLEQLHLASQELIVQEERNRIAREIHDGVSQNLALLMLKMEIISRLADSDPSRTKMELRKVMSILEASVQELRRSLYALRSPDLARLGFVSALKRLTRDFTEQTNVEVAFTAPAELSLPPEAQSAIFSAVQERLDSLARVGTATSVSLTLEATPEQLLIQLMDNSRQALPLPLDGENPVAPWKERLQERVRPFAGSVRVVTRLPITRVQIRIPRG